MSATIKCPKCGLMQERRVIFCNVCRTVLVESVVPGSNATDGLRRRLSPRPIEWHPSYNKAVLWALAIVLLFAFATAKDIIETVRRSKTPPPPLQLPSTRPTESMPTEREPSEGQLLSPGSREAELLDTLRNFPGVISIEKYAMTLQVGVSLNALGLSPREGAKGTADSIAATYKQVVGHPICVHVYYGDHNELARTCVR